MPPKIARLAGLGALATSGGLFAVYVGLVLLTLPGARDGIDLTNSLVAWISMSGVFAALIVVHIVIGRQLLLLSKGPTTKHPL